MVFNELRFSLFHSKCRKIITTIYHNLPLCW